MKKTDFPEIVAALLLSCVAFGCGSEDEEPAEPQMLASSEGSRLLVYEDPYAPDMPGTANPIPASANAAAHAFDVGGQLRIQLAVAGFPPSRTFGAHLHRLECTDPAKAGGHYQHMPFPEGGMATDPQYANATNEAWLDFTTDDAGEALSDLTMDWIPRAGEAKGIIIHHMATGTGGVSGAKLACLPLTGF